MSNRRGLYWLSMAVALGALSACDQVQSRLDSLSEQLKEAQNQIASGVGPTPLERLERAPIDDRALAGVQVASVPLPDRTLEEMLTTQSFFAVGSIIAQPKEVLSEAVVEEAALEDIAVDAAPTDEATETAPDPLVSTESEPLPPPPPAAAAAPAPQLRRAPLSADRVGALREAKVRDLNGVVAPRAEELMQRAEKAPADLVETARQMEAPITREALITARRLAREAKEAASSEAQQIGDEIVRQTTDKRAPLPRQLAVRTRLNVERALPVRERAYEKLESLGLSGIVTPDESGQMRIVIGVDPTKFETGHRFDPSSIEAMRKRFARADAPQPQNCSSASAKARMKDDPVMATECIVEVLKETGDYEYVEKDYIFMPQLIRRPKSATPTLASADPNDTLFALQWALMDAAKSPGGAGFRDFWAKAKTTGSKSVVVAVVDTGLQMSHPDIAKSPNLAPGFDMVSDPVVGNDGDGRDPDPNDPGDRCDPNDPQSQDTFHGTHVAGTVGAGLTNNSSGIAGGAWNMTLVPVRALGRCGGRLSDINDAIRWAAGTVPARDGNGAEVWNKNPADIINLSIGLFEPCPASMQAAIDDAVSAGAIIVTAAGNDRVDTKYYAPAGCRNVIAVAAGDARGVLAPYSNFGSGVAIMAPGGDMERDDDKDGRPDGILSTKLSKDCYDPVDPKKKLKECYYAFEAGTSMAAPHVSAALVLLKSKFPSAVPSELRTRLLSATSPRSELQCSGKCSVYPGTTPIPGQDGMCYRPCGGALLDLSKAALK